MKKYLLLLFLLPLVHAYTLASYTEGDVFVPPGKEVNLYLPFPEGNDCLPVAVLWVKGGRDYPVISVNGVKIIGEGMHRIVLRGEKEVIITAFTTSPALIEGNSLIYCTRDPFVFIEYNPPHPIRVGNWNFLSITLKNYGYSGTEVNVLWRFHPNLAPFFVPREKIKVPARKEGTAYAFVTTTLFLTSGPFVMERSAHPRVCIEYRDSIMNVLDCAGPEPTESHLDPRVVCINNECYNTSNLILEVNGASIRPGSPLSARDLNLIQDVVADIVKIDIKSKNEPPKEELKILGPTLLLIGLLFAVIVSALFK